MTKTLRELGFVHIAESYDQAIIYAQKRKSGEIKSLKTPWSKFNDVSMDGLEWNSLTVIAGRPGSGKTLIGSMISREAFKLNLDQDFCALDFQFEMLSRNVALREISGNTGINVRTLSSVGTKLTNDDLNAAIKYCNDNKNKEIYTYERPLTVEGMKEAIFKFYELKKKPIIITIDHSLLLKRSASEKDRIETLYNLGNMLAETRRQLPVCFIILSQLNREIESTERLAKNSVGNFVKDSDVFGADALLQFTDILVGINRPAKYGLTTYGPDKIPVNMNTLAVHFLKVRNGEPKLTLFEADFAKSKIHQIL